MLDMLKNRCYTCKAAFEKDASEYGTYVIHMIYGEVSKWS